jgi:hypothetical protein
MSPIMHADRPTNVVLPHPRHDTPAIAGTTGPLPGSLRGQSGASNREIARELGESVRTVGTHLQHILDKLGVPNRRQAALFAREHGLVNTGPQGSASA